jgi:hypothetical protein
MKDPKIKVAKTKKNAAVSEHRVALVTIALLAGLRHSWRRLPPGHAGIVVAQDGG